MVTEHWSSLSLLWRFPLLVHLFHSNSMVLPEMVQIPLFLRFTLIGHHFFFLAAEVQIAIIGSLELGIYHGIYYKMILNTIRRGAFTLCIYELEWLLSGLTRLLKKRHRFCLYDLLIFLRTNLLLTLIILFSFKLFVMDI